MRGVTGRWVWGLSGLVTVAVLAGPSIRHITTAGVSSPPPERVVSKVVTVPDTASDPVSSLNVQSYGDPVQVTGGSVRQIRITERIEYYVTGGGPPPVAVGVSQGQLNVADTACASGDCDVSFAVTVPSDVAVTVASEGGDVTVSGVAGANLDSNGGPVSATRIDGPLTASTGGGSLWLDGLTGTLSADTAGGSLTAFDVAAASASVAVGGGDTMIAFSAAPRTVMVSTDGGAATLTVPGGPYSLTADSDGGPELVWISTAPRARDSMTVITDGGPIQIKPPE